MTTATASPHLATIQGLYEAFGRGDVPAILDRCADDTCWSVNGVATPTPPWWGPFQGKGELVGFFQALAEHLQFDHFAPVAMVGDDRQVAVRLDAVVTAKGTGKQVKMEEVHWWSFDDHGKVAAVRIFEDSKQVHDAWQA